MHTIRPTRTQRCAKFSSRRLLALLALFSLTLAVPTSVFGAKKKKNEAAPPPVIDYSNIVWPNPPAIARIRYQAFYSAEKLSQVDTPKTKKDSWMDRLAGTQPQADSGKVLWQLAEPYGMALDSKGSLYVADQKVGAIFIFNTETREVELIKNKTHAHFVRIIGLAMDDDDRLFVSDPGLSHILVFNPKHEATDVITEGMVTPGGMAIDTENRLLYVSDVEQDQVLVYDADSFKLKRRIGTGGKKHALTTPGDFARPGGLAVDSDGNLYVADTLNDRVEIFDGDGTFIRTFGKAGDGPGYFSRPKGVAIDSDNHIWVVDGMQDRVQVFNQDAQLLIAFGGHGLLPGMFQGIVEIVIDKQNRVFTSEIFPGRVQQFRYVTDAEADQLRQEKESAREKRVGASGKETAPAPAVVPIPAAAPSPQSAIPPAR
jgi:sugar lactone lactonase YvrE